MQLSTDGSLSRSVAPGATMTLMVGQEYWIKLVGSTATNGYEQIETFINFPNTIFQSSSRWPRPTRRTRPLPSTLRTDRSTVTPASGRTTR